MMLAMFVSVQRPSGLEGAPAVACRLDDESGSDARTAPVSVLVGAGDFGALATVDATAGRYATRSVFRVIGAQWPRQGTRQQRRRERGIGSVIARGIKCSQRHLSCEKRALELLMSRTLNLQAGRLKRP